jgi:hypothetical protein
MNGQESEIAAFLRENASAVFALLGALGTGVISLFTAWLLRRQDHSLRLWEKIAERRLRAHENLLESAMDMRVMVALGGVDSQGEPLRTPHAMMSREHFDHFFTKFSTGSVSASAWQTTEAKREANFVQDYMVTLYQTLVGIPSDFYPNVGAIVRQDFIDLSSSLERKVQGFFARDLRKLRIGSFDDWHKYPKEETLRRLEATELMKHQLDIAERSHPGMRQPLVPEVDE